MPNQTRDEHGEDGHELTNVSRRSYLLLSGAAAATFGGVLSAGAGRPTYQGTVNAVSIHGYGGQSTFLQTATKLVDEVEGNDSKNTAQSISVGTTVSGVLDTEDVDWYTTTLSQGDTATIEYERTNTSGVTAVILYDDNGDYVNLIYVGDDSPVKLVESIATSGTYYIEVVDVGGGAGNYTMTLHNQDTINVSQTPYSGTPLPLSGKFQAENYDKGDAGEAYSDQSAGNRWGEYRNDDVDIFNSNAEGGPVVGNVEVGDWMEYTIDASTGDYTLRARLASPDGNTGRIRVLLDGTEVGKFDIPTTGPTWGDWATKTLGTITSNVSGQAVLRIEVLQAGFDINWFEFSSGETTATPTPTPVDPSDYGTMGYGEGGYGGVSA